MSRTGRLFELLQLLRRHRYPVSGKLLADELGISLRTLYRGIATLQSQGAVIEGEAGVAYILRPGFMLPPLMFSEEEIEALVLGARWVARRTDSNLRLAASDVLTKISAVLPDELRHQLAYSGLLIGPATTAVENNDEFESKIREAIRTECKLQISYVDAKEDASKRIIWPLALGYFEEVHVIVAWCELRDDFRHFRVDRIKEIDECKLRYPQGRQVLLAKWRNKNNIPEQ